MGTSCSTSQTASYYHHYKDSMVWIMNNSIDEYSLPLVSIDKAKNILGDTMINKIRQGVSGHVFVPLLTLICEYPLQFMMTRRIRYLYRKRDWAVALDFNTYKVFLYPYSQTGLIREGFISSNIVV